MFGLGTGASITLLMFVEMIVDDCADHHGREANGREASGHKISP